VRVLVVSGQWFPDFSGGSARVATETARQLAERGHAVTALVPVGSEGTQSTTEGAVRVERVLTRGALPNTLTDVVDSARRARRLGHERFDVVLAHQSTVAVGAGAALELPVVRVLHALPALELQFLRARQPAWRRASSYPLQVALAALDRRSLGKATRIFVLSEFSRSLLGEGDELERKVRLVGGGVDTSRFEPRDGKVAARERLGIPVHGRLLVTIRRLEPRMGIENLICALPTVLEHHPDVTLAVVGDGSLRAELRRMADVRGLGDRVAFAGRVSDEDLGDWYRAADLFVLPTVAYEGFGMVTAEALASGTPVVGTPVGATPELLRPLDPRLVAPGAAPDALATAIVDVLPDADRLAERCRVHAERELDWRRTIVAWERELEAAVRGDGTP
jgi:glycosyltransferase involved in cell wall biosynthesis